jgi:hypothetical protein
MIADYISIRNKQRVGVTCKPSIDILEAQMKADQLSECPCIDCENTCSEPEIINCQRITIVGSSNIMTAIFKDLSYCYDEPNKGFNVTIRYDISTPVGVPTLGTHTVIYDGNPALYGNLSSSYALGVFTIIFFIPEPGGFGSYDIKTESLITDNVTPRVVGTGYDTFLNSNAC